MLPGIDSRVIIMVMVTGYAMLWEDREIVRDKEVELCISKTLSMHIK